MITLRRVFESSLALLVLFSICCGSAAALPKDPRLLYLGISGLEQLTAADLSRLQELRNNGLNTIILPLGSQQLSQVAASIRANPILSQFKYVVGFGWLVDNQCLRDGSCINSLAKSFGPQLERNITEPIKTAQSNPDLFVGYYLFDEPMINGIPAVAQEFVYNFVRSLDPDSAARPALSAHANWILDTKSSTKGAATATLRLPSDQEIQTYMSPYAQDIVMSSQYAWDLSTHERWIGALQRLGFFNRPFIQIIPSFTESSAGCTYRNLVRFTSTVRTALGNAGVLPQLAGFGYFSFWKTSRQGDFAYDLENCSSLVEATIEQLQSETAVIDARFDPSRTSYVNEYWQPIQFNDQNAAHRSGGAAAEIRNVRLSGGDFIGSGIELRPAAGAFGMAKALFQPFSLPYLTSSYFVTNVGLDSSEECGNGVRVSLLITDFSNNGVWSVPLARDINRNQGKTPLIVDLSPWNNHQVGLGLLVSSRADASCDRLIVERPRIVNLARRVNPFFSVAPTDQTILHPFNAQWTNDWLQALSFNVNLPADTSVGYGQPVSYAPISGATINNGAGEVISGFEVRPPRRANAFAKVIFTSRPVPASGKTFFVSEVGLLNDQECGDGVTIEAVTKDLVTGYKKVQGRIAVNRLSGISQFSADLETTRGHQMEFQLIVKSNASGDCDRAVIGNPRILRFNQ